MANATCQACRKGPFHSLGRGHPEFSDYGAEQAGHLRFTHTAHLEAGGHFAESDQAAPDCRACHVLDADDAHALLRDNTFSRWCAECHSGREFGPLTLGALPPAPAAWLGLEDWPVAAEKDDALDPAAAEPTNFVRALLAPQALEGSAALRELVLRFQDYALDYIGVEEDWDGLVTEDMRLEAYEQEEADARAAEEAQLVDPARRYAEAVRALLRASASPRAFEALLAEAGFTPGPQTRALSEALPAAAEGAWRYEGYGHEDPFLTAWLELAETLPPGSPRLEALRDTVRGRCVVCHQLDEDAEGVVVRWDAAYSGAREQTATRFAHGPHLELPGITDCASCHALKAQPPAEEVESRASDFELVRFGERAVCATCHAPRRAAGDACVSCHDYHVGRIPRAHPVWDGDPARLGARAPKTPDEAH
ncbi:MAG: cytochrome c3 family protein [Planctomycetota bacterium]